MKRFKGGKCSLEFRGFHNFMKKEFIKFTIISNSNVSLSVSHSSKDEDKLVYVGTEPGAENLTIICADNILDGKVWENCNNCDCRVIAFCDPKLYTEMIANVLGRFTIENNCSLVWSKCPIKGSELSVQKQDWLFEQGKVCINGKELKIRDIFPECKNIIREISGSALNELLTLGFLKVCKNYKIPVNDDVYVERQLYFTDVTGRKRVSRDEMGYNSEDEFLVKIQAHRIKSIHVYAKSGMGKSTLLVRMGKKLQKDLVIFCSFRHFVDLISKKVGGEECSKDNVIFVIQEILGCTDECEKCIMSNWLEQKNGTKIYLQLDGLDESTYTETISQDGFKCYENN